MSSLDTCRLYQVMEPTGRQSFDILTDRISGQRGHVWGVGPVTTISCYIPRGRCTSFLVLSLIIVYSFEGTITFFLLHLAVESGHVNRICLLQLDLYSLCTAVDIARKVASLARFRGVLLHFISYLAVGP